MKMMKIKLKMRDGMQDETVSLFIFWEFIFRPKIPPFLVYSGALPAVSVPFFRHYMHPFSSSERPLSGPICLFFPGPCLPLSDLYPSLVAEISAPFFRLYMPPFSGSTCRLFRPCMPCFSALAFHILLSFFPSLVAEILSPFSWCFFFGSSLCFSFL